MTISRANMPYPKKLTVALTDRCNLKCFICTREEFEGEIGSKGSNLVLENIRKLEPALREAKIIQLTGFGETFLHPQLGEALDYIYAINPREDLIYFVSNGTLLSHAWGEKLDKRLNYLAISLNAARPETYKRDMHPYLFRYTRDSAPKAYQGKQFAEDNKRERPCQFEQTVGRIGDFMSALSQQSARRVSLHYVVHRDNIDEMAEFIRLAHSLGISQVSFTHYLVNRVENIEFSIFFEKERYNTALNDAVVLGLELGVGVFGRRFFTEEERTFDAERDCDWPINQAMVFTRGESSPCCYIGEVDLGNAFKTNFDDVWNGKPYQKLRRERWMHACQNCSMFQTFDDWKTHFHHKVKLSPRFNELAGLFVEPAPNAPPRVLVLGAGRDGTRSLGRLVANLHAANGEQVSLHHEANSFRAYAGTAQYHTHGDGDWMRCILDKFSEEIISGNAFNFVLPLIHDTYGSDVRVMHIKRDRKACIASMHSQALSDPLAWDGYINAVDGSAMGADMTYEAAPPTAVLLGEMEADAWNLLSLDDRLAWLYDASHRAIEANLHLFPKHLLITTEELDDPAAIRRITQFVNPAWRQTCTPVHLNSTLHDHNAEPAQSARLATQNAIADFDLHQLTASDTYPVIYFLQRMIATHNSAAQDKTIADLENLRDEITILLNRAEGRLPNAREQNGGEAPPILRVVREPGVSNTKIARLDDTFHDFEPEKLEASATYPVIYFLQKLLAAREVTGDGDQELATVYRFMGDQVDALMQMAGEVK